MVQPFGQEAQLSLTLRRQCKTMASVSPSFHLFSFSCSLIKIVVLLGGHDCCSVVAVLKRNEPDSCFVSWSHSWALQITRLQKCIFKIFVSFETRNEIVSIHASFSATLGVVKSIAWEHVGWRWSGTGVVTWLELFWANEDSLTSMLLYRGATVGRCGSGLVVP